MTRKTIVLFTIFTIFVSACIPATDKADSSFNETTITTDKTTTTTITDETNTTSDNVTQSTKPVDKVKNESFIKIKDSKIPEGVNLFLGTSVSAREQEVIIFALQLSEAMFNDVGEIFNATIYATNNRDNLARLIVKNFDKSYDEALEGLRKSKGTAYYGKKIIVLNLELINSVHGRTIGSRDAALTFITLHEASHFMQAALSQGMTSVIFTNNSFIEGSANEFAERAILRYLCVDSSTLRGIQFPYVLNLCDEDSVQNSLHKQAVAEIGNKRYTSAMLDYFKTTYGPDTIEEIFRLLGIYFEQHPELTIESYKETRTKIQNLYVEIDALKEKINTMNEFEESFKQLNEQLSLLYQEVQALFEIMNLPWLQTLEEISGLSIEELQLQLDVYLERLRNKKD